MKAIYILLCMLLCAPLAQGQTVKWTTLQEEPSVKPNGLHIRLLPSYHHFDEANQHLYNIRLDGYLTVFDEHMKEVKSLTLSFENDSYQHIELERGITADNQFVLIFTGKKKGDGDTHVFARKIDKKGFSLHPEIYPIASYPEKSDIVIEDAKVLAHNIDIYDDHIRFASSPNKQFFLLTFPGKVPGREESCHVSVFNPQLKTLWSGGIQMTKPDGQLAINAYEIDNQGNVYIAGEDIHAFQKGIYSIFVFKELQLIKEHHLNHDDGKRLFDMSIDATTGIIQCAGFYAEEKKNGYSGVAHIALSPTTHEVVSETYTPFADNIQELFMTAGEKKKKAKGLDVPEVEIENFTDKTCIATHDGGVILLAEYNGIGKVHIASTESYTEGGYYAQYGDIMAVKLDAKGKTIWSHLITKPIQEIGAEYRVVDYASFQYFMHDNHLMLYFNKIADKNEVHQMLVTITPSGQVKQATLAKHEGKILKGEVPFAVPVWSRRLSPSALLLYNAYSDQEYRLGILKP